MDLAAPRARSRHLGMRLAKLNAILAQMDSQRQRLDQPRRLCAISWHALHHLVDQILLETVSVQDTRRAAAILAKSPQAVFRTLQSHARPVPAPFVCELIFWLNRVYLPFLAPPAAVITGVENPTAFTRWYINTNVTINYLASSSVPFVQIYLLKNGTTPGALTAVTAITTNTSNTGTFTYLLKNVCLNLTCSLFESNISIVDGFKNSSRKFLYNRSVWQPIYIKPSI